MATSEDPDQTARMRRLVWIYTGRKDQIYILNPYFVEADYAHATHGLGTLYHHLGFSRKKNNWGGGGVRAGAHMGGREPTLLKC